MCKDLKGHGIDVRKTYCHITWFFFFGMGIWKHGKKNFFTQNGPLRLLYMLSLEHKPYSSHLPIIITLILTTFTFVQRHNNWHSPLLWYSSLPPSTVTYQEHLCYYCIPTIIISTLLWLFHLCMQHYHTSVWQLTSSPPLLSSPSDKSLLSNFCTHSQHSCLPSQLIIYYMFKMPFPMHYESPCLDWITFML